MPAHIVAQINDIFAEDGITPQDNGQVEISATNSSQSDPFCGCASVVRSGSGDAIIIFGTNPNA